MAKIQRSIVDDREEIAPAPERFEELDQAYRDFKRADENLANAAADLEAERDKALEEYTKVLESHQSEIERVYPSGRYPVEWKGDPKTIAYVTKGRISEKSAPAAKASKVDDHDDD